MPSPGRGQEDGEPGPHDRRGCLAWTRVQNGLRPGYEEDEDVESGPPAGA